MTTLKRPRPTRRRAPNGRGSFQQEPDGTWRGWISLGNDPVTGKPIRKSARGKTYTDVAARIEKLQADYEAGNLASGGAVSVEAWLRHWLAICIERQAPATVDRKEWAIHNWLIPAFEDVTLEQLDPELIEKRLRRPRDKNGVRGSDSTRVEILRVFKTSLELAKERGRIRQNPAATVNFAVPEPKEIEPFDREELALIIAAVARHRNSARWLVGFALGLRQSEVLGLKWSDIDFETESLWVQRQWSRRLYRHGCDEPAACPGKASKCPKRIENERVRKLKTKGSRRTIHLMPEAIKALQQHQAEQQEYLASAGARNSGGWVFINESGDPIEHRGDLTEFKQICRDAGVKERRVHDLRHTTATALMMAGVSERQTQDLLGWSTARMAQRYQHVIDEAKRATSDKLSGFLFGDS